MIPTRVALRDVMISSVFRSAMLMACIGFLPAIPGQAATLGRNAEVQINLCSTPEQAVEALRLKPVSAEDYEVWYFETADLALFHKGVVVRLRVKADATELTLKFADQDCTRIAPELLPAGESKCEYDVWGTLVAGAVSVSRRLDDVQVRALMADPAALPTILSAAQIEYLRQSRGAWPLPGLLKRLGPARVQVYRREGHGFVVEAWQFPSGWRILEISQKAKLPDAPGLNADLEAWLTRHHVAICADQGSPARAKFDDLLRR
jgi:hypothetical protein